MWVRRDAADRDSVSPVATAYPPPLSAPPTVDALRGLLDGLQDPTAAAQALPPPPPGMLSTALGTTELQALLAGLRRTASGAFDTTTVVRWRVEHAHTGVPVWIGVGDRLSVRQLIRLRNELLPPPVVAGAPAPPGGPVQRPAAATGPPALSPMTLTAPDRGRLATGWSAIAVAVAVTMALGVAVLLGLDVPLP